MPRVTSQAILFVDGYNIIGAWEHLKQARDRDGMEPARRELVEALVDYSAYQGFKTQVVFDAQYQDTPGSRDVLTANLSICYTDYLQTADSYIEQACSKFRDDLRKFNHRLIVATSDRAQQLTVVGYGAEWMSANRLQTEVELITHRIRRQLRQKTRSPRTFLSNSIDPVARQQLAKLRLGISSEQP
jgi:uncharacterized protein